MTALTATALLTAGYKDAQKLARQATLDSDQLSDGIDRLNDLINLWQTQGLKLFLETEIPIVLIANQAIYSIMPGGSVSMAKPLQIKDGSYVEANGNSRPLIAIGRSEWSDLPNRFQTGQVIQYFVEKLYDRLNVNLWQIPDANAALGTVRVTIRQQATNPVVAGDSVKFPPEWALALRWGIADEVAFGMPEAVQQRCQSRAQAYRAALEDWDVEDVETTFQPDTRWTTGSRFR